MVCTVIAVSNFINAGHGTLWMGSPVGIKIFNPHTVLLIFSGKRPAGIKGGEALIPVNVDTYCKKPGYYDEAAF
jgi:hypothetical protein